ncbi:cytochrome b/b6 domain-containing protein [Arthrobacter sp. TES]|uniref:Cytochrome b/b6 domain-containing protein n=1 Tax=Paenarthrobacter ureafaciens TaxID=37931 RepID=A0AAX3EKS8_PAEUR|nr:MULTISPECIES: cytochrome b/b6 domain-containing protein [Paenarthrobacter]AOY72783.1 membrane protein [Arthrobacter sp. ZXY-2]ERI38377.1 membrane protein [Arthrobacter sp. AK-YN10]NKR12355.1 hypothetical protein [Arthrobacter sp. M5]NKR14186.1 hypothetical protein [Arthrobacter sp. M6]OEH61365.1 hypothetical protein A5N17_14775 [Arthrobacter sp. D2]OEH64204.1 hypothetical protein A5N13_12415 [Arthrobacter sp. D4]QOI64406.1 cytochrome b/b6 domain-containing protein [Arthrobacter sp. TES]
MSVSSKSSGITSNRWFKPVAVTVVALVIALILVLVAQWLRTLEPVKQFLTDYPGHSELPEGAPTGLPAWLGWQHFLNMFFIVLIIRSGWQVRTTTRPPGYWTRNNKGFIKTRNAPTKISLDLWFHLTLDALWVLNGLIFIVLLFATGQWMRIVPTSWDVFPNAVSAGLQYASLNWPLENGWVNYNALQLLTYFITVFIAAPLAIITGIRMSGAWPKKAAVNKFYPIEAARKVHFPVMIYFVAFVIVHVTLVLATGALRNLNHMYASTDDANSWWGFAVFAASIVVTAAAWFLARPLFLRPIASLMGKVTNR